MNPASGPFAIAATLLVVGGAAKAIRPLDTANALLAAGVPITDGLVRVGAAVELGIGLGALIVGGAVLAGLVAASFALFALFVGVALVRHLPIATCGCFGKADAPPSLLHVVVNLGAVVAAVAIAIDPGRSPIDLITTELPAGILYALLVGLGTSSALLALTVLPRTLALVRAD